MFLLQDVDVIAKNEIRNIRDNKNKQDDHTNLLKDETFMAFYVAHENTGISLKTCFPLISTP